MLCGWIPKTAVGSAPIAVNRPVVSYVRPGSYLELERKKALGSELARTKFSFLKLWFPLGAFLEDFLVSSIWWLLYEILARLLIGRDFLVLYEILAPIREYEKDFQKSIKIRGFRFLAGFRLDWFFAFESSQQSSRVRKIQSSQVKNRVESGKKCRVEPRIESSRVKSKPWFLPNNLLFSLKKMYPSILTTG